MLNLALDLGYGVRLFATAVSADVLAVAAVACYVPARRAALIDPLEALRAER